MVTHFRVGVIASQPVSGTLFALKMAPVEGQNKRSMFLTSSLAVIFGLKILVFSRLYRVPKHKMLDRI